MPQLELTSGWTLQGADGGRRLPLVAAARPANVHLTLLAARLIDDPRTGIGVLTSRWVETCRWSYSTKFDVPPDASGAATRRVWLVFDQILGSAQIALNGETIATHSSALRPCRVDVTTLLRPGLNGVVVEIGSVSPSDVQKLSLPRRCAGNEWSPRLIPFGLAGPVRLEWTHLPVRVDALAASAALNDSLSAGQAHVRQFVEVLSEQPVRVTLLAQLPEAGVLAEVHAELPPGLGVIEAMLDVPMPRAWFPAGLGAQNLYTLLTTVIANGNDVARKTTAIGFRHVQIDQGEHALARVGTGGPAAPAFPFVRVNGHRVFCKAATMLPDDLLAPGEPERLKALLAAATEAGLNALVLPADAGPGPAALYDLADRSGMMLFQELHLGDDVVPVVRGLAAHPSLVAWCGPDSREAIVAADRWRAVIDSIDAHALEHEVSTNWKPLDEGSDSRAGLARALRDFGTNENGRRDYPATVARGESLCAFIESVRRQTPHVAGLHLHRLNDCWPATRTPALVDHDRRRMPAWYYARRALTAVHVTIAAEADQVVVFGLNDTAKPALGDLRFGVVQLDGMFVINRSVRVQLNPRTCTRLVTFPLARWRDRHKSVAFALLSRMNRLIARNCLAVTPPDQLQWEKPDVQTQLIAKQVTFTSPTFARGVCLDDSGEQSLADNYFDLYPGIPHTIAWTGPHVPKIMHVANG